MAHWMKKAFENAHGQFSEKAKAAGKSTSEYASAHAHDSGKEGKQARLALVGMGKDIPKKPEPPDRAARRYDHGK